MNRQKETAGTGWQYGTSCPNAAARQFIAAYPAALPFKERTKRDHRAAIG